MITIEQLLGELELHDSTLQSLRVDWNGAVSLSIDIDDVWNKGIDPTISGVRFPSVYEIVDYKIDRMNIIGSVEFTDIEDYNRKFVVHDTHPDSKVMMVDFEFVAGGRLSLICSDEIEYLNEEPEQDKCTGQRIAARFFAGDLRRSAPTNRRQK